MATIYSAGRPQAELEAPAFAFWLGFHCRIIPSRGQPQQETFRVGSWSRDFGRNESTRSASRVRKLPQTARD
jgi:hypothetical protein